MPSQSNTLNKTLMKDAFKSLKGRWGVIISVMIVSIVIEQLSGAFFTIDIENNDPSFVFLMFFALPAAVNILLMSPIYFGLDITALSISRNKKWDFEKAYNVGFDKKLYKKIVILNVIQGVIVTIGYILFIIPGIIAQYCFTMSNYILYDNKKIDPISALKMSYDMMNGFKLKLFYLNCRFIGWYILSILTFGIGFLWSTSYYMVSHAKFYDDIIKK